LEGCRGEAERIHGFISWRLRNQGEYRAWLRGMLKAWGALLNEANNERSLLPFAAAAMAHLAVGLAVTEAAVEGVEPEEALRRAEEQLCAVYEAARMLLRDALESGEFLRLVKEALEELEREGGEEG